MRKQSTVLLLSVLMSMIPAAAGAFRLDQVWQKSFSVGTNPAFELENVNGSLWVEVWDQSSIEVTADIRIKAPSKSKAEHLYRDIDFLAERDSAGVSVKARTPRVRQDSFLDVFFSESSSIRIRFHVKVPRGASLRLSTVNGDIEVALPEDVGAGLEAKTSNGRISSDFPLDAKIKAERGLIRAVLGDGSGTIRLETVNGDISLRSLAR